MEFLDVILSGFVDVLGVFHRWRFSLAAFAGLLAAAALGQSESSRLGAVGWAVFAMALVAGVVWEYRGSA